MLFRLGLFSVLAAAVLGIPAAIAADVKEPPYTVISSQDGVELRSYAPQIRAETVVRGPYKESLNDGFRILANYIFGGNTGSRQIAMTAPVGAEPAPVAGEKIAMTAPVGAEPVADGWLVSFVMPTEYTMDSLPEPLDARVILREVPAQQVAALRFRGWAREDDVAERSAQLSEALAQQNLVPTAQPVVAQYNPPWTLPFLRRNELLVPVQQADAAQGSSLR